MKLCAIYNVWADWDILEHSLKNIRPLVDGIIIVGSENSNFKEFFPIPEQFKNDELFIREPHHYAPQHSETDKRNFGLNIAREQGYTHFLTIDSDEFYDPEEFLNAKELVKNFAGLVCTCTTYFRRPTLSIGLDITLVPFIHEITPTIKHDFNMRYPFAWRGKQILIDPTRSLNINTGVHMTAMTLHHYSWIRSDFKRKIRNSTAKVNLERSSIWEDLVFAKEGYFCKFYGKQLHTAVNRFNIPDYGDLDENLQSGSNNKSLEAANQKN